MADNRRHGRATVPTPQQRGDGAILADAPTILKRTTYFGWFFSFPEPSRKPQALKEHVAYHVTPARNLPLILAEGLEPRRGRRSADARESGKSVFLFANLDSLEYGIDNWIPNMFAENTKLALLAVDTSGEAFEENGIELIYPFGIHPRKIKIVTEDIDSYDFEEFLKIKNTEYAENAR